MNPVKPIPIDVWETLQHHLTRADSKAVMPERFILQRDAYIRLSEDDIIDDAPFLTYDYTSTTSDTDLLFSLYFYQDGITVDIGPANIGLDWLTLSYGQTYAQTAAKPRYPEVEAIVQNIIDIITLLLNGQIVMALDYGRRRISAVELFIRGFEANPFPFAIVSVFPRFAQSSVEVVIRQNHVLDGTVKVTADFPLLPPVLNGSRVRRGRSIELIDELEPITKREALELTTESSLHESFGKAPETGLTRHLYKSVPFWITALSFVALALILRFAPFTPAVFHSPAVFLVIALIARYAISYVSGYWLAKRYLKIKQGGEPVTYRIERWIGTRFHTRR